MKAFTNVLRQARRLSTSAVRQPLLFKEKVNVLYDSKCSLCMHEMKLLSRLDKEGKIKFTDLEDPYYDQNCPTNGNVDYETGMEKIHVVRNSGEILTGVDAIRTLYETVGFGFIYGFTTVKGIKPLVDSLYDYWARYRTVVTRGKQLDEIIAERNRSIRSKAGAVEMECDSKGSNRACSAMKNA